MTAPLAAAQTRVEAAGEGARRRVLPAFSAGSVELMKLVAFAAMIADHANKIVYAGGMPSWTTAGRIAFPLFALVVAINALRHTTNRLNYVARLLIWGAATQPVYTWATGRPELNILFTLGIGLMVVELVERLAASPPGEKRRNVLVMLVAALAATNAADYGILGGVMILVMYDWLRRPAIDTGLLVLGVVAGVNLDPVYALPTLLALPIAVAMTFVAPRLPHLSGWGFYILYPGHLAVLRWLA